MQDLEPHEQAVDESLITGIVKNHTHYMGETPPF